MIPSSATCSQTLPLRGIKPKQFLVIAVSIAQDLGWNVHQISKAGLTAFTGAEGSDANVKITIRIENYSAQIMGEIVNKENEDAQKTEEALSRFNSALYHPTHVYSTLELAEGYKALEPYLIADESVSNRSGALKETGKELLALFQHRENYFITPLLMTINIIVFLLLLFAAQSVQFTSQFLLHWGANARLATLHGEPWRLLTNCFLHWDFVHLLMNMMALYFIGSYVEQYLGKIKFIVAYLLMGIVASLASLYWHEQGVSAGASGAIFGLYGIFLAFLTTSLITPAERKKLLPTAVIFIGYSLLMGMSDNIDNAAHMGGLFSGLFFGYCLYPIVRRQARKVKS